MQTSLKSPVHFRGVGLHRGRAARIVVRPAPAGDGIRFRRTDIEGPAAMVPAHWQAIEDTTLCTRLGNRHGVSVSTVEHLMAALSGCGILNALIDIDGPEVPILDGSAAPFVAKFLACGVTELDAPVRAIRVLRPVEVRRGDAMARLDPAPELEIDFGIDFDDPAIGRQRLALSLANGAFVRELSDSRTFCRLRDVDAMRARGLALGGSFENAVVVDGARVLSPGGLRHRDEAVRHKMLDALGDLALAGAPLLARYTGRRAGHALTADLLRQLFDSPASWETIELGHDDARRLPGYGMVVQELRATA